MSPLLGTPSSQLWLITSRCFLSRRASEGPPEATRPFWARFFGGVAQPDARTQVLPCTLAGRGQLTPMHASSSPLLPQTLPPTSWAVEVVQLRGSLPPPTLPHRSHLQRQHTMSGGMHGKKAVTSHPTTHFPIKTKTNLLTFPSFFLLSSVEVIVIVGLPVV